MSGCVKSKPKEHKMSEDKKNFETEAIRTQLERTDFLEHTYKPIILNFKFCI